ncbi:MAG: class I SAM-dependent methyltransferase [Spirochaetia bacterium]
MKQYSKIAELYESIFPVSDTLVRFIAEAQSGSNLLLDVGCATGQLCRKLEIYFSFIIGIDNDPEMVRVANQRSNNGEKLDFRKMSMQEVDGLSKEGPFNQITCMGNTFVHLEDYGAVNNFLETCYNLLSEKGVLQIQILNYDRIVREKPETMPDIKTGDMMFTRKYEYNEETIKFITGLQDQASGMIFESSVSLLPIIKAELEEGVKAAGFSDYSFYQDFNRTPWEPEGFLTILETKK